MGRLALAAALAGLLVLPATAPARGEPRAYRGTLVIDQRELPGAVPSGSSMSYRFHARYSLSGRRQPPYGVQRGAVYSLAGRANQTLAYKADLHRTDSGDTYAHVADWHGAGRWTKRSGQVLVLNVFGRSFGVRVDLNLPPKTIPLSVSSEETDVSTTENGTCVFRGGLSGPKIWVENPCEDRFQSLTIPKGTAVNPAGSLRPTGTCGPIRSTIPSSRGETRTPHSTPRRPRACSMARASGGSSTSLRPTGSTSGRTRTGRAGHSWRRQR